MELPFYHHIKSFFVSDNFLFVLMSNLAFVVVHGVFFLWCFPEIEWLLSERFLFSWMFFG